MNTPQVDGQTPEQAPEGDVHVRTPDTTSVSALLGAGTRGAFLVYALFAISNTAFAIVTLDRVASPWPVLGALVVINATALLLARRHPDPFPLLWSLGVVAAVAAATALISWQLIYVDSLGREMWHVFANTWMLFFLVLRGRTGFAWLGFLGMIGIHMVWASGHGASLVGELEYFQSDAGILVVASLFAVALRRVSRRINALNTRSVELSAATATAQVQKDTREARLGELTDLAGPLLQRVVDGPELTWEERTELLLAEATLRDSVRAPSLNVPEVVRVTAEARRRGVEVTLLDDRGEPLPTPAAQKMLNARVAECIGNVDSGRVAVRLSPPGRRVAASMVVETTGRVRRTELDENAEPISTHSISAT